METKDEWSKLVEELDKANYYYYYTDQVTMTDSEFDRKLSRLKQLEEDNPELRTADSPTQKVGGYWLDVYDAWE